MKKALLGTSALVAASVLAAGPAIAAKPLKLGLGGYMEQSIGFADYDSDREGEFDVFDETEVHFKGSTTLDNGIKVAVHVELEGTSKDTGDRIDEAYMTLTTPSMGQVIVGSENMPNYKMHYGAPTVSRQNLDSSDYYGFWAPHLNGPTNGWLNAAYGTTSGRFDANDPQHIAYYTPRVAGFQLGVGYAPDTSEGNSFATTGFESGMSVGLNYRGEFEGLGMNASFGLFHWAEDGLQSKENPVLYQGGANITFSGFAVGAAYATTPYSSSTIVVVNDVITAAEARESWTLNVGASYKTGPYGVSVNYQTSKAEGSTLSPMPGEDELTAWEVAATYNLGPGINWHAAIAHIGEEGEDVGDADDRDSLVGVTGIVISF